MIIKGSECIYGGIQLEFNWDEIICVNTNCGSQKVSLATWDYVAAMARSHWIIVRFGGARR